MSSVKEFPEPSSVYTAAVLRERMPGRSPAVKIARAMRVHKAGYPITKPDFVAAYPECWRMTAEMDCLRCKMLIANLCVFVDDDGCCGVYMLSTEHPSLRYGLQALLEQYGLWENAVLEAYTLIPDILTNLSTVIVARLPDLRM